jgi:hypothetical protein
MRKALRISVLIMVLAISANAGDMQNGVTSTPRLTPAIAGDMQNGVAGAGEMQNGVASTSPAESTATDLLLTLLQSLLALF